MATGAVMGGICGAVATAIGLAIAGGGIHTQAVLFGTWFGAGLGAVAAPIVAWGLLRHVPLGRAIAETALGSIAGATVGWLVPAINPLYGAVGGFVLSALQLRLRTAGRARIAPPPDDAA
jgi:hypothetical protein